MKLKPPPNFPILWIISYLIDLKKKKIIEKNEDDLWWQSKCHFKDDQSYLLRSPFIKVLILLAYKNNLHNDNFINIELPCINKWIFNY